MKKTVWLTIDLAGEVSVRKRKPTPAQLAELNVFSYELVIEIPDPWFRPLGRIELELPDPPDVVADVVALAKELRA
jgi:hypothetical protein